MTTLSAISAPRIPPNAWLAPLVLTALCLAAGIRPAVAQEPPAPPMSQTHWLSDFEGLAEEMPIGGHGARFFRVYASGLIVFDGRLDQARIDAPTTLSALAPEMHAVGVGAVVAPFWNPLGGVCEGDAVNDGRNDIRVRGDGDGISIVWDRMTRRDEACAADPETFTFSARLSWPARGAADGPRDLFRVEFDYGADAGLIFDDEPRAGVVVDALAMELLPDQSKGRARALARGGSGDVRDGEAAADALAGVGYWVIEIDGDGTLFGDEGDGIRVGDNCPDDWNPLQSDLDGDRLGDACDLDIDGDQRRNYEDNCPRTVNREQGDADGDGLGDACDGERDGDAIPNRLDNCPSVPNPGQFDADWDGIGDACDDDPDGDGVGRMVRIGAPRDLCPWAFDPLQGDADGDGLGDACDRVPKKPRDAALQADADGDGVLDLIDICPFAANPAQHDADGDGLGDLCDPDTGDDGKPDVLQGRCHSTPDGPAGRCRVIGGLPEPNASFHEYWERR